LAIPELGAKQICPHCQAKFYDLSKRPARCPKCGTEFDPDEAIRNRRVRARVATPESVDEEREDQVPQGADGDEEEEDAATPELDEVADEPPLSGDDEDEDSEATPAVSEDLGEFSDEEDVEDDADVPFLEEDEDDFDDSEIEGLPDQGDDE